MSNLPQMTLPQIEALLALTWQDPSPSPVVLLGPPGAAKSSFCRTLPAVLAAARGVDSSAVGYLEFVASQRDPSDVAGIALPAKTPEGAWHTHYTRSPLLCLIEAELAKPGVEYLVLNIDEITQCGADMQKALRGSLDADTRTIGDNRLPDNVVVVATGNRLRDRSGSGQTLAHVANATFRVEVVFDTSSWQQWAETQGFHPLLIGAVGALTESAFFVEAVPAEDTQFCTPRSFARVAQPLTRLAARQPNGQVPDNLLSRRLAESAIGQQAAEQLFTYLSMLGEVPTAAEIQADPEGCAVSDAMHFQHAAAQVALSSAEDRSSAERALLYITRLRADLQISTAAVLMRRSARQGWKLGGPVAQAFIAKYHDLLPLTEGVVA